MKIDCLILGAYQTNCYTLRVDASSTDCVIVDTGLEADELVDFLGSHKLNPAAVILTHGHADHIAGLAVLRKKYPHVKVYIHKLDEKMLSDQQSNLCALAGVDFATEPADIIIEEGYVIDVAGIKLEVFHTPGHTPGGICLYSKDEQIVFTGDTLFADSVGRTDLPGGSMVQLITSIKEKLCTLPDETRVYPGHGPQTTMAIEKSHNQYLQ